MTLGEKIREARKQAGLSQKQLCGDRVTRNMLSQIENGTARPSVETLRYFAAKLEKSMGYFLDEEEFSSSNQRVMEKAREALGEGNGKQTLEILKTYRAEDPTFAAEKQLLECLAALLDAERAAQQGMTAYAQRQLKELSIGAEIYCAPELERRRLLLLGKVCPAARQEVCRLLPPLDEELLLRAQDALERKDVVRCVQLLEAAQERKDPQWNFLRGQAYVEQKQYRKAAACFHRAESRWPEKCAALLEICYRELGDYKKAYLYACKQR